MSAPFVGRAHERSAIRAALADARAGRGGLVLVSGEAGAGESRLLADLGEAAATTGMLVLRGAAIEGGGAFRPLGEALLGHLRDRDIDETPSLRPYRSALHRLLPDWPAETGASADPASTVDPLLVLGEGLLRLLTLLSGERGAVLLLEDLHWADPDTLAVLQHLVAAAGERRLLVAASLRTDETSLAGLTALRRAGTELALGPLPPDDTAALARALLHGDADPKLFDAVVAQSDGIPLLIEQLCRHHGPLILPAAAGGWRHPLQPLIAQRMARLQPVPRQVLAAAAVLGVEVPWQLLAAAADCTPSTVAQVLPELVIGFLEFDSSDNLRWRHAALRDAVVATLLPPETSEIAARACVAWETSAPPTSAAELRVDLLLRAGRPRDAASELCVLADSAAARSALQHAEALLRRAESLGGGLLAITGLVRVLDQAGRAVEAMALGERALKQGVPGHTSARADEERQLGLALSRAALTASAWRTALMYLDRWGRLDPMTQSLRADALFGAGDLLGAQTAAKWVVDTVDRTSGGDVDEVREPYCRALMVLGQAYTASDPEAGGRMWERAADVAAAGELGALRVRAEVGCALVETIRRGSSDRLLAVRNLAENAGMPASAANIDILCADVIGCEAGPHVGLPFALRAAETADRLQLVGVRVTALMCAAQLAAEADDPALLQRLTSELEVERARGHEVAELAAAVAASAGTHALAGDDFAGAYRHLAVAAESLHALPAAAPLKLWGLWAVLAAHNGRWDDEARHWYDESPGAGRSGNAAGALLADAIVAGRSGHHGEAERGYRDALDSVGTMVWWGNLLALVAVDASLKDGWGEPVAELRRLLAYFDGAGTEHFARMCRERLRLAGSPVPRKGRGATAVAPVLAARGVTSRELDVLALIRNGLSNAEIAARLFLSVRTVESHVAHLITKSGATSRPDLARAIDFLARGHLPASQ